MLEHAPTIFDVLKGSVPISIQALFVCLFLVLFAVVLVKRELEKGDAVIPPEGLNLRNVLELLLDGIIGLMRDTIGPTWPKYLPLVGTLGFFILVSNLMRQFPAMDGPTGYMETNFSWALMAFGVSEYAAVRHQGLANYIKHLAGPVLLIAPLMMVVELISHLSRAASLTIRLTGNMFADHTLVALFLAFPVIQWFVPWLFMGLGFFVAFVQAFVFTFLTIVYIGMALDDAHH